MEKKPSFRTISEMIDCNKAPVPSVKLDLESSPILFDKEPPDAASVDLDSLVKVDSIATVLIIFEDEVRGKSLDDPPERLDDILNEDDDEYEEVKCKLPNQL